MASQILRRIAGALSALLVTVVAVIGLAAPAHAETGYQYWHYFHLDGDTWAFSEVGPADFVPEDGDVEGFRFGTSTMSQPITPRADLAEVDFETVCGSTEAADGEKRVAIVLDFGTDEVGGTPPEPRADCAVGEESASTQVLIGTVADVRVEGGITCAFDGYPASGCGVPVADAEVPTDEESVAFALPEAEAEGTSEDASDDSTSWTLVGVGLLVVLIAAGAFAMSRRNRTS